MQRRQVIESVYLISTKQIFRESIRVILLHPTHFHSISIFLFSPLTISLFISHFFIQQFPQITSLTVHITDHVIGYPLPKTLTKTMFHLIVCFPFSITFSLIGRAATIHAVSDNYNRINLDTKKLLMKSLKAWIKLLHTSFWEILIVLGLLGALMAVLTALPKFLFASGFLVAVGLLGVLFCVAFAHIMAVGSLAKVLSTLESDCYGLKSLIKANSIVEGRRQTVLMIALLNNTSLRLVECLFEYRISKGISIWECPVLVSMYSSVLVFETLMNVVYYYACKS